MDRLKKNTVYERTISQMISQSSLSDHTKSLSYDYALPLSKEPLLYFIKPERRYVTEDSLLERVKDSLERYKETHHGVDLTALGFLIFIQGTMTEYIVGITKDGIHEITECGMRFLNLVFKLAKEEFTQIAPIPTEDDYKQAIEEIM